MTYDHASDRDFSGVNVNDSPHTMSWTATVSVCGFAPTIEVSMVEGPAGGLTCRFECAQGEVVDSSYNRAIGHAAWAIRNGLALQAPLTEVCDAE